MSGGAHFYPSLSVIGSSKSHTRLDDAARVVVVHTAADAEFCLMIAAEMRSAGYDTSTFEVARSVVDRIAELDPDLVLVIRTDDSFNLSRLCSELQEVLECRKLVIDFTTRPSGTLSADEEARMVEVLEAGADDYLPGRATSAVLHARVRVALRARPTPPRQLRQIEIGDVVIDVQAHAVLVSGTPVKCRPLQFNLLVALAARPNEMVTTQWLITNVWGVAPDSVDTRRVRIAISVLRRVLGSGPLRPNIELVARLGYRLAVPVDQPYAPRSNSSGQISR